MKKVLKYVVLLMAIVLAGTVAYVSVNGLLRLFAGAGMAGAIIFWSMEVGKIIMTSAVHTYRKVIKWYVRLGLNLMILATMVVTSVGIYGFLSSSYKESYANLTTTQNKISLIDEKRNLLDGDKELIFQQIESKRQRIKDQSSIRDQQETRLDSLYARRWYTAARRTEKAIVAANDNITKLEGDISSLNAKMGVANDSVTSYNLQIIELKQNDNAATELGPLLYLSDVTGMSMDDVMKWFILLIMVIGDPQAVLLVIVFNSIVNNKKKENEGVNEVISDSNLPGYRNPPPPPEPPENDERFDDLDELITTWEPDLESKYSISVDPAIENAEPTIINNDTGEIVFPEKKPWSTVAGPSRGVISDEEIEEEFIDENQLNIFDQQSESPTESPEIEETEVVENEPLIEELPSELPSESLTEIDDSTLEEEDIVIETENTKKYKLDITDLPEVESDNVSRYSVELPKKRVVVEEVIDEDAHWVEDKESEDVEVEIVPNKKVRDYVKGRAIPTKEGITFEVKLPEEVPSKQDEVEEILAKKKLERETEERGFSKPIPKNNKGITPPADESVFIRKRKS